jgi:hypothetical protein
MIVSVLSSLIRTLVKVNEKSTKKRIKKPLKYRGAENHAKMWKLVHLHRNERMGKDLY